jgi:cellulose synthase/poly-beta-1,6-N-acetylglucosamine synthase-like glycosyltransferase
MIRRSALRRGAIVARQPGHGYADALFTGFRKALGRYFITMDADYSHDPDFIEALWQRRDES